jgi:MTH538 TIR-like domain (DUF1863)
LNIKKPSALKKNLMARVFISFDYEDIHSKKTVDNWKNQDIGTDIAFSSWDGKSESSKGEKFVKKRIREMINQCHKVLVLVGDDTHNRPWVDYEIAYAKSQKIEVIWTQLPGTTGAPPREIRNIKPIPFDMKSIREAIRKTH